ncbi:hypothetical protein OD91_1512 [Lutibacter sp. Hel_I_33_5]|uniref:hypothetical protein n=1 Tax=Lutibacter sp. Hel_I_33_5 TaxID=1566289 RepID=UPI00119DFA78|nr:hypothetical protein [Lutibacter sp. Hel_I_33_5]TVZ56232.1 hypothetical protein OD91_1512 [Lutibacter sp. Hel_I_33_5]
MDKKKENRGSLISSIGGLFTIIGMTLLAMKSSVILYLSCTIIGVILAAYGVFVMLKAGQLKKEK